MAGLPRELGMLMAAVIWRAKLGEGEGMRGLEVEECWS